MARGSRPPFAAARERGLTRDIDRRRLGFLKRSAPEPRASLAAEESIEEGPPRWRRGRGGVGGGWWLAVVLGTLELLQVCRVERSLLLALAVRLIRTQGLADRIARDRGIRSPTHSGNVDPIRRAVKTQAASPLASRVRTPPVDGGPTI